MNRHQTQVFGVSEIPADDIDKAFPGSYIDNGYTCKGYIWGLEFCIAKDTENEGFKEKSKGCNLSGGTCYV